MVKNPVTIPKVIHQTWKTAKFSGPLLKFKNSWIRHNPNYSYRFYDDKACAKFIATCYPRYWETYTRLSTPVQKADLFRYLVIHKYGGIYADMDMECYQSFDRYMHSEKLVFSIETRLTESFQQKLGYKHPYQIANCIFASPPNHPFLLALAANIKSCNHMVADNDEDIENITGPRMLSRMYYALDSNSRKAINILPQIEWMATGYYPRIWPFKTKMYARHHFMGSWKTTTATKTYRQRWEERSLLHPYINPKLPSELLA